jgi:hypothetical protein
LDLEEGGMGGRLRKVLEDAHATRKPKDYEINAATFAAPLISVAYDAAKKGRELASKKERDIAAPDTAATRAAMKIAHEKVEAIDGETKLEVVKKYYPQLKRLLRYMRKNYMSNYMLSKCNISGVTVSYKEEEENYPSATFQFESVNEFNECKKKLKLPRWIPWMLLEKSLTVKLNSQYIEEIYKTGYNYDVTSRKKMMDIDMEISSIGNFLIKISWFSLEKYKTELNKYFIFIIDTFKINEILGMSESDFAPLRFFHQQQQQQEGGQMRRKLKKSQHRKKQFKSKNKTRTKLNNKIRTKLNNKIRTK